MATIFIKNMVCNRCIMVVQHEMDKLGLGVKNIKLGEVTLEKELRCLTSLRGIGRRATDRNYLVLAAVS